VILNITKGTFISSFVKQIVETQFQGINFIESDISEVTKINKMINLNLIIIDFASVLDELFIVSNQFRKTFNCQIVVYNCITSFFQRKEWEEECYTKGITGCVYFDTDKNNFLKAIEVSLFSGYYFCNMKRFRYANTELYRSLNLTPREEEILFYIQRRYTNKMIAQILNISINTVNIHVSRVLIKTGKTSRYDFLF